MQASDNAPGMRLVICKYYYDRLAEKKLTFGEMTTERKANEPKKLSLDLITLCNLSTPETNALYSPEVIRLFELNSQKVFLKFTNQQTLSAEEIESEILFFEQAKELASGALQLLKSPYFFNEIKEHRLTFTDIKRLDEKDDVDWSKGRCISLPSITRLIQQKCVTLHDLKKFTLSGLYILQKEEYGNMLLRDKNLLKFFAVLNETQQIFLENESILRLIVQEKISILAISFMSRATYRILIHPYYNSEMLDNQLRLCQIEKATLKQVDLLKHSAIIKLLDAEVITIDTLLELSLEQVQTLMLSNLNEALIAREISYQQALSLTTKQHVLFESVFYYKIFHRKHIPFDFFSGMNDELIDGMLSQTALNLARDKILTPQILTHLTAQQLARICGNNMCYLLWMGVFTVEQVKNLSFNTATFIENNNDCCEFLKRERATSVNEITTLVWAFNLSKRMHLIFLNTPLVIENSPDTLLRVRQEIELVATSENISDQHLLAQTLKLFLYFLQQTLNNYCHNISYIYKPAIYTQYQNIISALPNNANDNQCIIAFLDVINAAANYLQQPSLPTYQVTSLSQFFQLPEALTPQSVRNFSIMLLNYTELVIPNPQNQPQMQRI